MILKFQYNVKKNDVFLKALKHHEKNNPKTYVFKKALCIDGKPLNDMEGVYKYTTQKELETYESNESHKIKTQTLINNYLKEL